MLMTTILLIAGLLILIIGADLLVRGSATAALRLGMNPVIIGLTIVAFGTSMPELLVSVRAALLGTGDLAVGNVIGSNICNIGLIIGLSALINPLTVSTQTIRIHLPLLIVFSGILTLMLLDATISRGEGGLLLILFFGFCGFILHLSKQESGREVADEMREPLHVLQRTAWLTLLFIPAGITLLYFGAGLFVKNSIALAEALKISQRAVGLTIVALGTSLPELATSIVAVLKKQNDIAVGNIIGSNIFNILSILGTSTLIRPIHISDISFFDLAAMMVLSVLALPLMRTGFVLKRWEGLLLLLLYGLYIGLLF